MDIYLKDYETGSTLRFPMLPEKISLTLGNTFGSYSILGLGEVKAPAGQSLSTVSWSGMFPGECRKEMGFVRGWLPPQACCSWIEQGKVALPKRKKLHLLVTETSINLDVYLERFTQSYGGGMGDVFYDISFVQGKDLLVTASSSVASGEESFLGSDSESTEENRDSPGRSGLYTVVKGDSLWRISLAYYGTGLRYGEIYQENQAVIDEENARYQNSKYTIYPGQVFVIP